MEATAIESGSPRNFFILVTKRDDGMVIRPHPSLDVEKTEGGERVLALVAKQVISAFLGTGVGKTNLQGLL